MLRALYLFLVLMVVFVILSLIVAVFARGISKASLEKSLLASATAIYYGFIASIIAVIPVSVFTTRTEQTLAILFPLFLFTGFITIVIKLGMSYTRFLLFIPALLLFREALLFLGVSTLIPYGQYMEPWSLYRLIYPIQ